MPQSSLSSPLALLNRLLPFATPGTPLVQDLLHLGVICALLYFAPQIQERVEQWREQQREAAAIPAAPGSPLQEQHQRPQDAWERPAPDPNFGRGQQISGPEWAGADGAAIERERFDRPNRDPNTYGIGEGAAAAAGQAARQQLQQQRNVSAKKAKSLARRDQRRAHNEFQRSQGEAQRAQDAEGASEREAQRVAERARREKVEAEIEARKVAEREKKRERERREREEQQARRERAVAMVREQLAARGKCNLIDVADAVGGDVDERWVEKMLDANGMLGRKGKGKDKEGNGEVTMVTSTGWVVTVADEDMHEL